MIYQVPGIKIFVKQYSSQRKKMQFLHACLIIIGLALKEGWPNSLHITCRSIGPCHPYQNKKLYAHGLWFFIRVKFGNLALSKSNVVDFQLINCSFEIANVGNCNP